MDSSVYKLFPNKYCSLCTSIYRSYLYIEKCFLFRCVWNICSTVSSYLNQRFNKDLHTALYFIFRQPHCKAICKMIFVHKISSSWEFAQCCCDVIPFQKKWSSSFNTCSWLFITSVNAIDIVFVVLESLLSALFQHSHELNHFYWSILKYYLYLCLVCNM